MNSGEECSNSEMLKYAIENGIIDATYIQEQIEMKKREEILLKHPYTIWQGSDCKWRTYLPDESKPNGRRMVKKSTESSIKDSIVEFYRSAVNCCEKKVRTDYTFKEVYFKWREVQDKLVQENSTYKYNTDYNRYFKGTEFEQMLVTDITEETIKVFMHDTVQSKNLCKSASKTLFGYINSVIRSARINKIIDDNPMEFLASKDFYKFCQTKKKALDKQIFSDKEIKMVYIKLSEYYQNEPNYIPNYAVELSILTGMRVGELSSLEWSDIAENYITIRKSEKYNRISKQYYIDKTKNGKERVFPITNEIKDLLERLKKVQIRYGYVCNWIFANENGRIHAPVISSCIKNRCRQLGITEKGIHAFRKTINSKMKCSGVSSVVAASLLGHSEKVNEDYYTFDTTDIDEKMAVVEKINAKIVS